MKHLSVLLIILCASFDILAQNQWVGQYEGFLNGDKVILTLQSSGNNVLTGSMKDSGNNYTVSGVYADKNFFGKATESNLGIEFQMESILKGKELNTTLAIDVFGVIQKLTVLFVKKTEVPTKETPKIKEKNPVSNKSRDPRVIGSWTKESNYSSGYGQNDSYGAMNFTETMTFLSDGAMLNGGSNVVISGNSYSGESSSQAANIIEGLYWYTDGNKIYLHVTENNQTQTIALGTYYIENKHMLITGANGIKILLSKK
jgi:hypothetical protein